ncbi:MAG TPA: 2Fe-2S iron-sulfur cluster-binding protein [Gemmatimonadaceae bacterium]|nr:2Fe-2S iron-sulfur cluster-binding protein [Gemmatimonadaceae bacterium]
MTAPVAPANPGMVTLSIEGRTVIVPPGTNLIEAAKTVGVLIPHYCYHPSLPVAGVCRMCLVEVEKFPKLTPACATSVGEGQVVHVHSEKAREARKGVLEFLLINHPLDCPICDQSGECELQDYTFAEGRKDSRYMEPKRFNPMEDFGGDVLYVPNRCILCTRCVRFMDVMVQDPVLNVSERGDRAYIGKFEGSDLTHAWASNVVDLCPVGALLSKDFLNKARAWELDRAASICPGCSQGCNVMLETRDNIVVRLRPRPNAAVNQHFACDVGRLNYRWINRRDRLEYPQVRTPAGICTTSWSEAIDAAATVIGAASRVSILASPSLSNEALFVLGGIATHVGTDVMMSVPRGTEVPLAGAKDLALRAERAANHTGAALLGITESTSPMSGLAAGDVLIIADADGSSGVVPDGVRVILLGTVLDAALAKSVSVALPICNFAEEDGTFTNLRGRVQRFLQARTPPVQARPSHRVIGDVAATIGAGTFPALASDVFAQLATTVPAFAGMSYRTLGLQGALAAMPAEVTA